MSCEAVVGTFLLFQVIASLVFVLGWFIGQERDN